MGYNGFGLRIAGVIRDILLFMPDTEIEVEVFEYGLRVRKAKTVVFKFPYSENELLDGLVTETVQGELLAEVNNRQCQQNIFLSLRILFD